MKMVYICWYHYWDYENSFDDCILDVFDSEEKAKKFVMDCAVEYIENLVDDLKSDNYNPDYAQAEITRLEAVKNSLSFDEQRKNVCICDDCDERSWSYQVHEVK